MPLLTFASGHHFSIRHMARVPMEKGPLLHLRSMRWILRGRIDLVRPIS
jgi:hypothetical protein